VVVYPLFERHMAKVVYHPLKCRIIRGHNEG
jgi:hypothetical protein